MNIFQYFKIAALSLWANKVRSALTMLGVIIGVFSVITFLAIGEGLKDSVNSQFDDFGSNLLIIVPGKVEGLEGLGNTLGASTLSIGDVDSIRNQSTHIESITPLMVVSAVLTYENKTVPGPMVIGTDPSYATVQTMKFSEGTFFTKQQYDDRARVAVVAGNAAEKIFRGESGYGKTVKMFGEEFTVIATLKKPEGGFNFGGGGPDDFVYIPFTTAQELTKSEQVARIMAKAKTAEVIGFAQQEIKSIVMGRHGQEDFTVLKQDDLMDLFNELFDQLTTAVSGIGAISLLVGGIGIMNIMFVSVTERTREIGLRKAVGATNSNILLQFLTEASMLSILGGGIGVLGAWGVTAILSKTVGLPASITLQSVILAFGISLMIGVVFGIVPAIKASRKNPIESLRYE
jgi:putative ABC transport system permease protein